MVYPCYNSYGGKYVQKSFVQKLGHKSFKQIIGQFFLKWKCVFNLLVCDFFFLVELRYSVETAFLVIERQQNIYKPNKIDPFRFYEAKKNLCMKLNTI